MADDGKSAADLAAENELIREGIALNEKNLKIVKEIRKDQEDAAAHEAKRLQERTADQKKSIGAQNEALKQQEAELTLLEKKNVSMFNFLKKTEHHEKIAQDRIALLQDSLSLDEKRLALATKDKSVSQETLKGMVSKLKQNKRNIKTEKENLENGLKGIEQGKSMLKNLGAQALGQSKIGSAILKGGKGLHSMWKLAGNLTKALRAGAVSASMLTAALGIGIILLVVAAIAKLIEFTIMLAVKTRDATVAFQRSTGAAAKFGKAIPDLEYNMRAVGVSMEEATAAQGALYKSTTDYTMASGKARDDLYKTTALMGEFGVSVETSAKIAQAATKGLGIGIGGADELLLGLSAHASDIGVPISKMMEDFAASADELKRFGSDGERVFKRLAMVSKVTGMEIGRILAITEKFDTFEGAAKQAGMLNAAIGGNMVNAMDLMMTTDPVERFSMIKDSIMDTVGSFNEMSYYQKKFYANAAGLKDVGELAAMMSGDFNALDGSIGQTSKDFEKQRAKAKNWQSTMDLLKNTLASFLPTMKKMQKPLQDMLEAFAKGEGPLQKLGDSFALLMETAMLPGMKALPEKIIYFVDKLGELSDWFKENKDMIIMAGKAMMYVMIGIGAALALVYAPIGLLVYALTHLVLWLGEVMGIVKKKNSPSFLDLFTGGMLAKSLKTAASAFKLLMSPIIMLGNLLGKLGHLFAETFNFDGIKDNVSKFVKWLPGEWAESVTGIKTEMEISSPSEKMMREVIDPTFVQPMQSVAAKMPALVDEVYAGVPDQAGVTLGRLKAGQVSMDELKADAAERVRSAMTPLADMFGATGLLDQVASAMGTTTAGAGGGPQTTQVSIPISIGKDQLGTVVTEIVDGRLGAVSYQGMAGH
ncbi:MAG TPA: hypothetical protein EYN67_20495 [Flavobacteriales bacterium]|nr:hypothetical protein [Flavobacteriales bacterium]HIO38753.1 hypothetical protein [Rhodospirillales bacterium]